MTLFLEHILSNFKQQDPKKFMLLFKKSKLYEVLNQPEVLNEFSLISAYLNAGVYVRSFFDNTLVQDLDFKKRIYLLRYLAQLLNELNLLQEKHLEIVMEKGRLGAYDQMIDMIKQIKLGEPVVSRSAHKKFPCLFSGLLALQKAKILNEANFKWICTHKNVKCFSQMIVHLNEIDMLNDSSFRHICDVRSDDIEILNKIFSNLKNIKISNKANFNAILKHSRLSLLDSALLALKEQNILNEANLSLIVAHQDILHLSYVLSALQKQNILNEANLNLIVTHQNISVLYHVLSSLRRIGSLTQDNFVALLNPLHAILLTQEVLDDIWHSIPRHHFTQENFNRLIRASEHPNPLIELRRVRNQIIGYVPNLGFGVGLNQSQSTHTASVHRSASQSAMNLKNRYGSVLNEETIRKLMAMVNALSNDSFKYTTAKRAIQRLLKRENTYTDRASGVSVVQLLGLSYLAIHDADNRTGTAQDAAMQFIEGLYEIQRGYNLNEIGRDLGGQDRPICLAGTFNKIMEKLNGIHRDVTLQVITPELANLKFPSLVKKHAIDHLKKENTLPNIFELLDALKENESVEPIWDAIKTDVEKELWDEFKEAFSNNPENTKFSALISNGMYVSLSETELEQVFDLSSKNESKRLFWDEEDVIEIPTEVFVCDAASTLTAAPPSVSSSSLFKKDVGNASVNVEEESTLGKRKFLG